MIIVFSHSNRYEFDFVSHSGSWLCTVYRMYQGDWELEKVYLHVNERDFLKIGSRTKVIYPQ